MLGSNSNFARLPRGVPPPAQMRCVSVQVGNLLRLFISGALSSGCCAQGANEFGEGVPHGAFANGVAAEVPVAPFCVRRLMVMASYCNVNQSDRVAISRNAARCHLGSEIVV